MKIFYGFLNYRQEFDNTREILEQLDSDNHLVLMKSTSGANFHDKNKYKLEKADESIPVCYNRLIRAAKEANCDYCFLIADDIKISNKDVFQKYVDFAERWKQELLMFPYNRHLNVALSKYPNPSARVKVSSEETVDLVRFGDSDFMCIKLVDDQIYFDERLSALYLDYFINDNVKSNKVHTFGFFLDPSDSCEYIGRDPKSKTIKTMFTDIEVQNDTKIREGEELALSNDINEVVKYIQDLK